MRKKLANIGEVMLAWASQSQSEGRCGSVSFRGRDLYSYRALIGRILENGKVAISTAKYSVTTFGHQHMATGAAGYYRTLRVPCLDSPESMMRESRKGVEEKYGASQRARLAYRKEWYLKQAEDLVKHAEEYARIHGSDEKIVPIGKTNLAEWETWVLLQEAK